MGVGQFCTNPGLIITVAGPHTEDFIKQTADRFKAAPVGTLLSEGVQQNLHAGIKTLVEHGATLLTGGSIGGGAGFSCQNTLLRVNADRFLKTSEELQTEAFGNESLIVVAANEDELFAVARCLEGNLTGSVYSATNGSDDGLYDRLTIILRQKVGRLLNDKMPTGVAVVASMNHGGPFPSTGHPGFTAVGFPTTIQRFAMLQCYDAVRPHRLPPALQNKNPTGLMWRRIDGKLTQADAPAANRITGETDLMKKMLFLCTGNYYRSRFAEILFNWLAKQRGLSCRLAESRGLAIDPNNIGPMSQFTEDRLSTLGVPCDSYRRLPQDVTLADFDHSDYVIAVKEAEHRPLIQRRFPDKLDQVEFWRVHDIDYASPDEALPQLEQHIKQLVGSIRC